MSATATPLRWSHILLGAGLGALGMGAILIGASALVASRQDMAPAVDRIMSLAEPIVAIDGDTLHRGKMSMRLLGFDAPETSRAKCPEELALGLKAKDRLQALIDAGDWEFVRSRTHRDKYGRDLVMMKSGGRNVAQIMIEEGLAREYHGGRRQGWCAKTANTTEQGR